MCEHDRKRMLFLIGFMGSGKTTVGRQLARRLAADFRDTDEMIEEREGISISEIFAKHGEPYFRDLETAVLERLREENDRGEGGKSGYTVISVGGGLPVRKENRDLMHQIGTTFFLKAEEDTLVDRLTGSKKRPLLQGVDLRERIRSLFAARLDQYMDAADHLVEVDRKSPGRIAEEIAALLE